jgi:hypothetical protein
LCTPIAFENGQVVAVGGDLAERWALEEEARIRQEAIAETERQEAETAEAAAQRAKVARQEKIEALENEVKPVPVSNAALNLKLYRQLLAFGSRQFPVSEKGGSLRRSTGPAKKGGPGARCQFVPLERQTPAGVGTGS